MTDEFSIKDKYLKTLPSCSGVYQMFDAADNILYVGKAGNLKKRVSSYFTKQDHSPKTRALVRQIANIRITVTATETEALLLESNLIKSLRPKYNVLMRDDKSYPFIHIDTTHDFPRIEVKRCKKKPTQGDFYGPYPSVAAVRETVTMIQKIFQIRGCTDAFFNARTRPCLQYQIKRCTAPCTAYITKDAYGKALKHAKLFLQGKSQEILNELAEKMQRAVANLAFEEAATLRDQIKQMRLVQEQQAVTQVSGDADVIVLEAQRGFACVQCVRIRHGEVLSNESFYPKVPQSELFVTDNLLWEQVFTAFIAYYYLDMPERIPSLIVTNHTFDAKNTLEEALSRVRGRRCQISVNPRGHKMRWLDFAMNNLRLVVTKHQTSEDTLQHTWQALELFVESALPLRRIECVDISHTQGAATVASCVVFDRQGACKQAYRRFNITNITPGDDCAAIEQVLRRRCQRLLKTNDLPDILMIDGGKGQVAAAERVLVELGINHIVLFGIAKGPGRKAGLERFFMAKTNEEKNLPADATLMHFLQHIRDEAHRFAITAHRKKRQTDSFRSSLDEINGIGPKRKQALLHRFGGLRELTKASVDELLKVHGINQDLAMRIYTHFRIQE